MTSGEKKLFTPGPLGVSLTTRQAMLRDVGSRDIEFIEIIKFIRSKLLEVAGVSTDNFTCVPMQGSGTFAIEAVISTTVPRKSGKILILENGSYGKRIAKMCEIHGIDKMVLHFPEDQCVDIQKVEECLQSNVFTNIAIIHCETTSGVLNDVSKVGNLIRKYNPAASYIVDAMSSFGAVPLDLTDSSVDYLVSSANKCIEGVPGFAYVIAKTDKLLSCKGIARSLSLNLLEQYEGFEENSLFRFTPPTHVMLAFNQALLELEAEGGVLGRAKRYKQNNETVRSGMEKLGFQQFVNDKDQSYIITTYLYPSHPNFDFKEFTTRLSNKGQVIYPGKKTTVDSFRIGNIGHLFPEDMMKLLQCIEEVCAEMEISLPLTK
ncbi:bifunctional phosphonoacetaldehyde hydrolase/aminoethylphosphonate transaminase-like [Glandiceps talaboti]